MKFELILGIAALIIIAFFFLRWFQTPKARTERLAITVWAAFGPYDTAEQAEDLLYRACRAVFGKEGYSVHEKWIQGHINNFYEWEAKGDFLRAHKIQRNGLLLTAYGKAFKEAFNSVKAEATPSSGVPDQTLLGNLLVYQLCTDKFNIRSKLDSFVKELPENLKEVTEGWILIYLSWLYKTYAEAKYGNSVTEGMLKCVNEKLNKMDFFSKEDTSKDSSWKTFEFWFDKIDNATSMIGTEIKGTEIPFEVFVAMSFMALDAGSPYYKQKDFQDNEFNVANALAMAKNEAISFIQNSIDLCVNPEHQKTTGDISWSNNPSCFERHLQRKYQNPLFAQNKQNITQNEVDFARRKDEQDAAKLKEEFNKLLHIVTSLPDKCEWQQTSNIREKIDTLLNRAAEVGGGLGDSVSIKLYELRKVLVESQKASLADNQEALDALCKAEKYHHSGEILFNNVFVAQMRREDTPIISEDVIPALSSENPDTIRTVIKILDDNVRKVILPGCVEILKKVKKDGVNIPQLDEKLKALDIDEFRIDN